MEPLLAALISTAATTLVKSLASSSWEQARKAVGSLWRRVHPERTEVVEAELADARRALLSAREAGDDSVERDLVVEWQGRLRRLPIEPNELAEDLRRLIAQLEPAAGNQSAGGSIELRASASGHGVIYQAGRDQHNIG